MTTKLYAFWKYDTYPYFLGGDVTRINDDGLVETVQYGRCQWFKPVLLVPPDIGAAMRVKLRKLESEYYEARVKLAATFTKKLAAELPQLELPPHAGSTNKD